MSFLKKLFGSKPVARPANILAEYPDGKLKSAREALAAGLAEYAQRGGGGPAVISWQGQAGRPDSYDVVDVSLRGDVVSFIRRKIDLKAICEEGGFSYAGLATGNPAEINLASLALPERVRLLETIFVRHLKVNPFAETKDYLVGVELVKE